MTDADRFHATMHGPATRPNMTAVGTMVWLSSEIMFFAGLFAMYFTIRAVSPELWAERTDFLDVRFALINTTILVISSVHIAVPRTARPPLQQAPRGGAPPPDQSRIGFPSAAALTRAS